MNNFWWKTTKDFTFHFEVFNKYDSYSLNAFTRSLSNSTQGGPLPHKGRWMIEVKGHLRAR